MQVSAAEMMQVLQACVLVIYFQIVFGKFELYTYFNHSSLASARCETNKTSEDKTKITIKTDLGVHRSS